MRANVYVDGFNRWYAIRERARNGYDVTWLDLDRILRLLLPHDTIEV